MNKTSRRLIAGLLICFALGYARQTAAAGADDGKDVPEAVPLTYSVSGLRVNSTGIRDGKQTTSNNIPKGSVLTLTASEPIGSLYILWDAEPMVWELTVGEETVERGTDGYRHEYVPISQPEESLTIRLSSQADIRITEIYAFSPGEPPDWVQRWEPPCETADLLVIPTHADDEFIFFGGVIPTYVARGLNVQVLYMVNHQNTGRIRQHELLNGLWLAGVRHYPVVNDIGSWKAPNRGVAAGIYHDEFLETQVEMIRRFRPQVIVGHDLNGEYRQNVHIENALCLIEAVELAADAANYPESAALYGTWDTPKTYLHLYGEPGEQTILDYEMPLDAFDGMTAFEVAEAAYALHESQQHLHFRVYGSESEYDSHVFGLYRTLVGADEEKDDLMENLEPVRRR